MMWKVLDGWWHCQIWLIEHLPGSAHNYRPPPGVYVFENVVSNQLPSGFSMGGAGGRVGFNSDLV